MTDAKLSGEVYRNATSAWHQYLSDLSPLRPSLFRYCRGLTGNPWDADDLVQETLMRGFSTLGFGQAEITDPRAYLLPIASNAWIDWQRRKAVEASALDQIAKGSPPHIGEGRPSHLVAERNPRDRHEQVLIAASRVLSRLREPAHTREFRDLIQRMHNSADSLAVEAVYGEPLSWMPLFETTVYAPVSLSTG